MLAGADAIQSVSGGAGGGAFAVGPLASASQPDGATASSDPFGGTFQQLVGALQGVNGEGKALDEAAKRIQAEGASVSPSDMVMLSMRCDEFLFHCELTSNAANRGSDGLQELFREQS
jgi:hypothetical protein